MLHYVDHLNRSIDENPLLGQVLFRLDHLIKNFSAENTRMPNDSAMNQNDASSHFSGFSSTLVYDHPTESRMSLFEKISLDDLHSVHSGLDHRSNLSKTSLNISTSNTSNNLSTVKTLSTITSTHKAARQTANLLTKTTQTAINKVWLNTNGPLSTIHPLQAPRQRSNRDIKVLEHLLQRCEYLRRAPIAVRRYAGRVD